MQILINQVSKLKSSIEYGPKNNSDPTQSDKNLESFGVANNSSIRT